MKIKGRNIKTRVAGRVSALRNKLSRARYFRGHGVHSPFVYALVRHVFMCDKLLSKDVSLYHDLLQVGVSQHRAIELQNLFTFCGYARFGINKADADLCIVTREQPPQQTLALVSAAQQQGCTVAIMLPYGGHEREAMCGRIIADHPSTTVDNRGYLLIFNNYLPKQHFKV
ncbi:MAG: hypothetical protein RSB23_05230 [Alistipes sp.]